MVEGQAEEEPDREEKPTLGHNTFLLNDILNDITKQEDFSMTLYNKFQPCKSWWKRKPLMKGGRGRNERSHGHAIKCWVRGTPTARGGFPQIHCRRLRKEKQWRRLLITAEHELQKLKHMRSTKGWTGTSKGALGRQTQLCGVPGSRDLWNKWDLYATIEKI